MHCFLLHGVTGSGKTSVFIRLIDTVVQRGKQVILMVPEIALTPQIMERFYSLFGDIVAVIHSELSLGQRSETWRSIASGEAKIIIGTRSAVFAPVQDLGLIVVDEEGERTYKSDSAPRYHAISVAKTLSDAPVSAAAGIGDTVCGKLLLCKTWCLYPIGNETAV